MCIRDRYDDHYFTVLRYVERNPLRANMVRRLYSQIFGYEPGEQALNDRPPPIDEPDDNPFKLLVNAEGSSIKADVMIPREISHYVIHLVMSTAGR